MADHYPSPACTVLLDVRRPEEMLHVLRNKPSWSTGVLYVPSQSNRGVSELLVDDNLVKFF